MDRDLLTAIVAEAENRLTQAVNDYYDQQDRANVPRFGLAGIIQGIGSRVQNIASRTRLRQKLQSIIKDAHLSVARLANNRQKPSGQLLADVLDRVGEQFKYLKNYLDALQGMTRQDALTRIAQYTNPMVQTASVVLTYGMPALPHMPGDRDLDCKGFCKCTLRIEKTGERSWEVYWNLDPIADHCESCSTLADQWRPLRIVNGEIQNIKSVSPERVKEIMEHMTMLGDLSIIKEWLAA